MAKRNRRNKGRRPASDKAPAFQWYPKDAKTDERYMLMTHEERGIYRDLLDHQWLHGSIPPDITELATLIGRITIEHLATIWPRISACFTAQADGRLQNERLERQRNELHEYIEVQSEKGRKGAAKRWRGKKIAADGRGMNRPLPKHSSAPASSSAPAYCLTGSKEHSLDADKRRPKADPQIAEFIDWFIVEFQRQRDAAYMPSWGRDGQLVRTMLKATTIDKLKPMATLLLTTNDTWVSRTDRGIGILSSKFNWLSDNLPKQHGPTGLVGRDSKRGRTGYEPGKYDAIDAAAKGNGDGPDRDTSTAIH